MILPLENNIIDKKYSVDLWSTSKGTQSKYYKNNYWYKLNCMGCEGLAEELTSVILSCSNIKNYVTYEQCEINGKRGCKSESFLKTGEQFIPFNNLYKSYYDNEISDDISLFRTPEEKFNFIVEFVQKTTGMDCTEYLQDIFAVDCLIKNPDRHFGNLGLILKMDGTYKFAPIFDNGQGLYQNFQITPPYLDDDEKDERLCAATISSNFERQMQIAGNRLQIDYEKLYEKLSVYPESIAKRCLYNQLNKYKKIFAINEIERDDPAFNYE